MKSKKLRDVITRKYEQWAGRLGVKWWAVTLVFVKKRKNMPKGARGGRCTAACETQWEYKTATIFFNLKNMRHLSIGAIEETIIHEIMHIFLNEMREGGIKHEERVATQLSWAFMWTKVAFQEERKNKCRKKKKLSKKA